MSTEAQTRLSTSPNITSHHAQVPKIFLTSSALEQMTESQTKPFTTISTLKIIESS
ncbi:predicted protein [Sclerotinia sclerotiorum 1980 UF-70]|uniref:Uncharacterized protein n=1 Tax=Sclerotinia sclerotiorum (strain ATCC 18683 / 1980 / Ss-1) TaxID=665079 RepID=A7ESC7_SCLS1|nr:predicted protein [Sclerotinia sclerotiorum 1980 UF-70]EDN92369.1 predicted protein [Sclerotinia sclerotiorum 1980 UF-70]